MSIQKGVYYKGKKYVVEEEWPSPMRKNVTMYRLRRLTRDGRPGKTVITLAGAWQPKKTKVRPHSGNSGNGPGTVE